MRLDKDRIKESLNDSDIETILKDLGSAASKSDPNGKYKAYQTVCHCGSKHKLYYYKDSKMFHCYTDCQESFDIYELVIKAKNVKGYNFSFFDAVRHVSTITGKVFTSSTLRKAEGHIIDDWNWIDRYKRKVKPNIKLPIHNQKVLDVFLKLPHESWLNEGISYETQMKYKISYYIRDDRIVIPHFDIDGNLVGMRGRAMRQEDVEAGKKYLPLTVENKLYSFPTMFNLYGLHKTRDAIMRIKKTIIFEDEKSVMKCEDYYGDDNFAVATGGSSLSDYHRDTLLSLGIEEVFLARDKEFTEPKSDEAYSYAERLLKQAYKFAPYCRVYILFDEWNLLELKDSPADKGKEVLETLMRRKFEIKTTEGEI